MKRKDLGDYPSRLFVSLEMLEKELGRDIYLVGGTVRDWLLKRTPHDLDFTVDCDAVRCCRSLIRLLEGGTFVPLGAAEEDAGRVVWKGCVLDFSSFRQGTATIEEDLKLRDYTINAMGMPFSRMEEGELIDPLNGRDDLENKILRACPGAFADDPLRMLRGYRLWATLGFALSSGTEREIKKNAHLLARVSPERISYEMDGIMSSARAGAVVAAMAESSLLFMIIPELEAGVGLSQPDSHHLDVFGHSLLALKNMDLILEAPEEYYPGCFKMLQEYLAQTGIDGILKWGALLHDLGKPSTREIREDKDGRITFYGHDEAGRIMINKMGRVLRWSNEKRERVAALTGMHMHPFHLCNVRRKHGVSKRACLKLARKAGEDLIGLFLLAMADSLAGKGDTKPEAMERELGELLCEVLETYAKDIKPALTGKRYVTGTDLIEMFGLVPGPGFARILEKLEEARVEGEVSNREEALGWVEKMLSRKSEGVG